MQFRDVVESFYIETLEGFFFAVKGLEHPLGRWIAVLRYVPDKEKGDRWKKGIGYRRLYGFGDQEDFIKEVCPQYLAYDPVFRTSLQGVPRSCARRIYDPCTRLQELLQAGAEDEIERDAAAFAGLLQRESEMHGSVLGITGSLLIGLHKESSDLDIAVFGTQNCIKVFRALKELLNSSSCRELGRLDGEGMADLYAQRAADTRMEFKDFLRLESRKVNQGRFRRRTYFVRFVRELHETGDRYGRHSYTPIGRARISAFVSEDGEAIFTPCRYEVSGVRGLDGNSYPELREIVSFRGRFCEQARKGESVMAAGTLERVETLQGETWYRLLLGNFPDDTMIVQHGGL